MKHIVLLLSIFLFTGCGIKHPKNANLKLLLTEQKRTHIPIPQCLFMGTMVNKTRKLSFIR